MIWFKVLRTRSGAKEREEWVPETSVAAARSSGNSVVGLAVLLESEGQLCICTVLEVAASTEAMLKQARAGL